ncbi:nitroreductase family protein [Enterococcus faecalis]|nr:nitroreductase family protein [Enterococcus faecalis]EGO8858130.1 nitroreductase family protein [Enterococcus faecalis]EHH1657746.1 nitroreductase family protein [Enterococcus faecalis]EHZ5578723.1 nitroreductase family protein [Enterococcus faecalis]
MNHLEFLNARSSVRDFDPKNIIKKPVIEEMVRNAANAPSSNNFQPWKVVAVANKEKQKKLMAFAGGQKQVEDASVVYILFGDLSLYNIEKIMQFNLNKGILNAKDMESKANRVQAYLDLHPEDAGIEGLKFDLGLFSMNLMHVVRTFGYESVPMRGVDFGKVKEYLHVPENYKAMLILPVGKAIKSGYPHVRYELEDFFQIVR